MKKIAVGLGLFICLFLISQTFVFAIEDDGGGSGYTPPPYYSPQTAYVTPSYTATPIYKPPISTPMDFNTSPGDLVTSNTPVYTPPPAVQYEPAKYKYTGESQSTSK